MASGTISQRHSISDYVRAFAVPRQRHRQVARRAQLIVLALTLTTGTFCSLALAAVWESGIFDTVLVTVSVSEVVLLWITAVATLTRTMATGVTVDWRESLEFFIPTLYAVITTALSAVLPAAGIWAVLDAVPEPVTGHVPASVIAYALAAVILPLWLPALVSGPRVAGDGVGFSPRAVRHEPGFLLFCWVLLALPIAAFLAVPGGIGGLLVTFNVSLVTAMILACLTAPVLRYRGLLRNYPG